MSVIGPRPLLVEYLPYYTKEEHHRHDVRPGLPTWGSPEKYDEMKLSLWVYNDTRLSILMSMLIWKLKKWIQIDSL